MASPAWLAQEIQPSTPQGSVPGPSAEMSSSGPSTPTAAASAPGAFTPTSKGLRPVPSGSMQGPAQAGFANAPGPSFSYSVLSNASTASGSSQQSLPSSVITLNPTTSPAVVQPSAPDLSSFSYNISQSSVGFPSNQQFKSSPKTLTAVAQEAGTLSSTLIISPSVSLPNDSTSSSTIPVSSIPSLSQVTSWMPSAPLFFMPPGMPGTRGTPGPPGIAPSVPIPSNFPSAAMDSSSSAVVRPNTSTAPTVSSSAVQPQLYTPYASFPAMAASPQGIWLQCPQMGGIPRSPFQPYPAAFPGPFPLPARGMPLPSVSLPDSQPPGFTPLETSPAVSMSSGASGHTLARTLRMPAELPPLDIDSRKHVEEVGTHDGAAVNEQLDAWTAHKTEAGVVYYYNAVIGESTYAKPPGFKGESDKVLVQPTPVSTEFACPKFTWSPSSYSSYRIDIFEGFIYLVRTGCWSQQVMAKNITTTTKLRLVAGRSQVK